MSHCKDFVLQFVYRQRPQHDHQMASMTQVVWLHFASTVTRVPRHIFPGHSKKLLGYRNGLCDRPVVKEEFSWKVIQNCSNDWFHTNWKLKTNHEGIVTGWRRIPRLGWQIQRLACGQRGHSNVRAIDSIKSIVSIETAECIELTMWRWWKIGPGKGWAC